MDVLFVMARKEEMFQLHVYKTSLLDPKPDQGWSISTKVSFPLNKLKNTLCGKLTGKAEVGARVGTGCGLVLWSFLVLLSTETLGVSHHLRDGRVS